MPRARAGGRERSRRHRHGACALPALAKPEAIISLHWLSTTPPPVIRPGFQREPPRTPNRVPTYITDRLGLTEPPCRPQWPDATQKAVSWGIYIRGSPILICPARRSQHFTLIDPPSTLSQLVMDYITSLSLVRYGAQKSTPLDPLSGAVAVARIAQEMATESQRLLDLRLEELEQQKKESDDKARGKGKGGSYLPRLTDPHQETPPGYSGGGGGDGWGNPGGDEWGMGSTRLREDEVDDTYSSTVRRESGGGMAGGGAGDDAVGGRKAQERYGRLAKLSRAPDDRGEAAASRYDTYRQKELQREKEVRTTSTLPKMQRPTALW